MRDFAGRPAAATTLVRLAMLVLSLAAFVVVLGPPRRVAQAFGSRWGKTAPVWFNRLLCAGLGVKVRAHGALMPAAQQLIVANHVSWLDIPALGSVAPMTFLAKKEVGNHPVGRELVALQGAVYVERGRRSCIPAVNDSMAKSMRDGAPVVLFAEATTGDGLRVLRFRSSHFEAIRLAAAGNNLRPCVVQPVLLDYSRIAGLAIRRTDRPRIAWYGDMTFLPHLFGYLAGGNVTCDVYFAPPIRILPNMHRKAIAQRAEKAVRALAAATRSRTAVSVQGGDGPRPSDA